MHTCELFSVRKSKADFDLLEQNFDRVVDTLSERGVDVRFKTDVSADPKKLSQAAMSSVRSDSADILLFANALNSGDSSSFKKLFYELISDIEAEMASDPAYTGEPKLTVRSLGDLGGGYKGYCFRYKRKIFIAVPCATCAGEDIAILLTRAVIKASDIISAECPQPAAVSPTQHAAPKKKEGFLRSFFPHKGDTRGTVIRKIIVLIAILAFIGASVYVLDFFVFGPMRNNAISSEIQNIAYNNSDSTDSDGDKGPEQDWDALKKINKEIVGWIRIDKTPIDYPVLYHKGDDQYSQYYLKHTYKGEWSDYGSIFVDYRCKKGVKAKNLILHGHNMLNGSMFHELVNYSDGFNPKLDYYKKHSVITFNTPEGDAKWKIISVFKTSTMYEHGEFFNYMQAEFNSDAEFMNFVYNCRIRSMFNIPVTVNEDDQLLTLSTCSYEYANFRTVVVARKVRPDEEADVDLQLATVNSSPLYPDVYYYSRGGTRPDPLTFKTAYDKGLVSWYDGKGDLKGSEDLTGTIAANPTEAPTEKGQSGENTPVTYYFSVVYLNYDDSEIASYKVKEGDPVPIPDVVPTYEDDYYVYNFVKWDFDIPGLDMDSLNRNLTIYPVYDPVLK